MASSLTMRWLIGACAMVAMSACQQLPGSRTQQTTTGGTAAGAAVGAAVMENDLVGALLGGAAGAAGGYLIGARTDWLGDGTGEGRTAAHEAAQNARDNPASVADVRTSTTADLDDDGFVTTDELLAMEAAGLDDDEIIERLQETDQVFQVSASQRNRLIEAGLSPSLVARIDEVNREERDRVLTAS